MFLETLFTIARIWKPPKCPSADEWIKKVWYTYITEYYSAMKRKVTGSFADTWTDLEAFIQSEVSLKDKNKYHILTHVCGIQKDGIDDLV